MKEKLPSWDLRAFYKSINDPKIMKDLGVSLILAKKFAGKYRKDINEELSPATLVKILRKYESIILKSVKPQIFSQLVFEADSSDPIHSASLQKTMDGINEVQKELLFLEILLVNLSEKKLNQYISDKKLHNYKHYLENLLKSKPHRLTEAEEKILADKNLTSSHAFIKLFNQYLARKKFNIKINGKERELSEEQTLNLTYNSNRAMRKNAADALTKGLKEESFILTSITNTLSNDKAIENRLRKFKIPEESRHLSNEIDQRVVDAMVFAVTNNYKIVSDFFVFKKKLLKLDKLHFYDRYAPVAGYEKKFSYKDAQQLITKTFDKFSPIFGGIAKKFFDKNWIDAPPRFGKRGGAFCSMNTPDTHPAILTNFLGKYKDVSTLAHELGHGVNGYLMRKQTPLNFDHPLTLAETASVFCEMLLFEEVLASLDSKQARLSLYADKLGGIIATVFRQTAMFKFEQELHKQRAIQGELTTGEINQIWLKTQQEMHGGSVELTLDYGYWWSHIPHFIENPFYVYAYAFGELMALSLFAIYKNEGQRFVDKYIELLSAGSSASPQELLKPFGINLRDKTFWEQGINYISAMFSEAKSLSK